jgi:hypothetical protein
VLNQPGRVKGRQRLQDVVSEIDKFVAITRLRVDDVDPADLSPFGKRSLTVLVGQAPSAFVGMSLNVQESIAAQPREIQILFSPVSLIRGREAHV